MAHFDEKNTFFDKSCFFVNFRKNASKQLKSLVWLYVARFDEKNTFFDLNDKFLSISVKMLQNN